MKWNISEGTKEIIYCLLGLILVLAAFFFGFQYFRQENVKLKQQRTGLEEELKKLNEIQASQSEYEKQLQDYKDKIDKYYKEFPALVQARDQILYASELESRYDSMLIHKMDMREAEYVAGTQGDAMALYRVETDMECSVNYEQLKDFLTKAPKDGTRKSVDSVVLTTDESGVLEGKMDISMYYMTGTGNVYQPSEIKDITTGTKNLFQRGVAPQKDDFPKAETSEGKPQQ